ncbi:acyl-CoA thioesterase [Maribacter chungangensis]|uniref:Acyl-CoA thioesterase n=1 Tax=Maribacter chungangensis TaxID=1069117 RepID=A0ABW3B340_9FLAO
MNSYEKEITVTKDDLDDLDHVNNVRYVQWIQDISKEHWQTMAPKDVQEEVVWVVMTHHITYKAAAVLDDHIILRTYIKNSKGAKCTRVVEIYMAKTNALLVRSSTEWCLLNRTTFRPMRISERIENIFL